MTKEEFNRYSQDSFNHYKSVYCRDGRKASNREAEAFICGMLSGMQLSQAIGEEETKALEIRALNPFL